MTTRVWCDSCSRVLDADLVHGQRIALDAGWVHRRHPQADMCSECRVANHLAMAWVVTDPSYGRKGGVAHRLSPDDPDPTFGWWFLLCGKDDADCWPFYGTPGEVCAACAAEYEKRTG